MKIRVMIVDDHPVVREGIRTYLRNNPDIEIVAEAENGDTAIKIFPDILPDIVLMDLIMPKMNGAETTESILKKWPHAKIIALTSFADNQLIEKTIKAGAIGCVLKNVSGESFISAIMDAMNGKSPLSSEIGGYLISALKEKDSIYELTKKEKQVLAEMASGLSNDEIAAKLVVSPNTVKFHVSNILHKLNTSSRVKAVTIALNNKLL